MSPTLAAEIGARVQQVRLRRGLSVADLAKKSGVHVASIYRIEAAAPRGPRGPRGPQMKTICKLAPALDTDVDTLLGLKKQRAA